MLTARGSDRAVPVLPARDFDATEVFYESFGFERAFRDDGWMILTRGALELEFFPHPGIDPATSDFMCSLRVSGLDELYEAILRAGVVERETGTPRLQPIRMQPWGLRAGYLIDLNGTQLALIQRTPPEPRPAR